MSAKAIADRLEMVRQLNRLCRYLSTARPVADPEPTENDGQDRIDRINQAADNFDEGETHHFGHD